MPVAIAAIETSSIAQGTVVGDAMVKTASVELLEARTLSPGRFWVLIGWYFMRFSVRTEQTDWGGYKATLAQNSDVRKFNDGFRQILSGTAAQRAALAAWLDERFARRELVYGMHVTDRAHMTCLVFDYAGRHLHFIDGADGGLFLAAKELKQRVAALGAATPGG